MPKPQAERLQDINDRLDRRRLIRQACLFGPFALLGVVVFALALVEMVTP